MTKNTEAQLIHHGMNTVMAHRAYGKHVEKSLQAVRNEAVRLERILSSFISGSEISRINRSAGVKCERLSSDAYEVLSHAVEFSRCCLGHFDITIGPLVTLWNSSKNACNPPEASMIMKVLPLVNYADLLLDPCKKTAGLKRVGQSIDLGGIGKGFAGDKFLDMFKKYGISSAYTNIGGNVVALGAKPDGSPWRVGIQHPRQENSLLGLVSVVDKAVVTSGDYQRYFFGNNGKRYHHILDPFKGYPAESGLTSVTIVADNSITADALSTVLFVAGKKIALKLLGRFPGAEAILVDTDSQVYITQGLKDCFQAEEGISIEILIN